MAEYYADCAAGTLPNITFVDPPFRDGGGGDGVSADEHPLGDVRLGQAFMSDVVHAFIESPNWERGALFIVYDEWGGFFDHVRPPSVPGRAPQLEHRRRLRPDGVPHPGGHGLPLRASAARSATCCAGSSRSSA